MKQVSTKGIFRKSCLLLFLVGLFSIPELASAQSGSVKLDDFNRPNNTVLGIPSSGGATAWLETESASSNNYRARVESNMLVLSSYNNAATPVGSSAMEQVSFDVTNRFATIYNQASANLNWYFNFRQSRTSPSGFGSGFYGVAYVLGCTEADFASPTANGYAVVIGQSGTSDPVKLVRFAGGLTANSNLTNLITSSELGATAYYSVKVSFDPCAKTWSMQVRNDGTSAFTDPLSINSSVLTFSDQTHTNSDLKYIGAAFSHGTANEKALFDNLYLPDAAPAAPVVYSWNGSVSSNFDDAGNWTPARNCNRLTDIFSFASGSTITIGNIATQDIGQLVVSNKSTLILKAKTGATQTLSIYGGSGEDLLVEAGSNLIIDSNDPLELSLKTGATGKVSGIITFQNTAANLGRAHRLLAADANAISFESGSQFIARNLTGEPFGITGTANIAVFKANSVYDSKDGASPFGLTTPASKVVFETGSLYKHEQVGTAPKFDGRIYANFELNVSNSLAIIFGTSATTPTRIDNFTISSGTMNVTLASGSTPLPLNIRGNLTVASGAAFNYVPAAAVNTSLISFNGTSKQEISGAVNLGQYANLEINNQGGVNLNSNLSIKGNLQLTNGILTAGSGVNLTFEDNASVSGASKNSFVAGRILKTGDDAFTFPTGKNNFYAPVGISAPLTTTDQYAAEYFLADPVQTFGASKEDSLALVSNAEYWDVERIAGTSEVKVKISFDPLRSTNVSNQNDLRIVHFKAGTGWVNEGRSAVTGTQNYTLIETQSAMSSYSPFTFGAVSSNNVLPVELTRFSAETNTSSVALTWQTASEKNNARFEIERSRDGKSFEKIGEVKGNGTSFSAKTYRYSDKDPLTGKSYYRLKQIDLEGTFSYSRIINVNFEKNHEVVLTAFPNPAQDVLNVTLPNAQLAQLHFINLIGQVVKTVTIKADGRTLQLNIADLPAGTYYLKTDQQSAATRFIKLN